LRRRAEELEKQQEELIQDPVKRAEFQSDRMKAQLEAYRKRDEMEAQKRWFADNYGVPLEVLAEGLR